MPSNAAESSTRTVRIEGSLLSWNSLIKVVIPIFSPRPSISYFNRANAILSAFPSKMADIDSIT